MNLWKPHAAAAATAADTIAAGTHTATLNDGPDRGRRSAIAALGGAALLGACTNMSTPASSSSSGAASSFSPSSAPPSAVVAGFAPTGTLRTAINLGNPVLAGRDPATGALRGVSVDLATELARRLGVPLQMTPFDAAGKVVDAMRGGGLDLAFLAIDPVRGADLGYSPPYVIIEGAYLVRNDSPIRSNAEVDRPGQRIAVGRGSAYDLWLTREIRSATLVRMPTSAAVVDGFLAQGLEVAAGVRQQLEADARRVGGVRLLDGRFMVIEQAMALPRGRTAALGWLRGFVEEMKAGGFVGQALTRHRIDGAKVAPAA